MSFWGDVSNTYHEEQKQIVYAQRMGLYATYNCAHPPTFFLGGRSVIDIGGGPVSLLLKCAERGRSVVADPAPYPNWVRRRYEECGIEFWSMEGESDSITGYSFDDAWIYNVLQHVRDPELVIANARSIAKTLRIFEWIETDPYPGHPQRLEKKSLDAWLGASGFVANLNESGAVGRAYYGVFHSPTEAMTA
jgi:hypothetical protein